MKIIAAALVKAQKEFGAALKTSSNPHFKTRYADLSSCIDAVIDGLNNNGIFLTQPTHLCEDGVIVETLFIHESGEQINAGKLHVPASKRDAQGYGSALTYARRYSLMAACCISAEDDDGNAASKPKPVEKPEKPVEKPVEKAGPDNYIDDGEQSDEYEEYKIKITATPKTTNAEFVDLLYASTVKMLEFTTSRSAVTKVFAVNRDYYDKMEKLDGAIYKELLDIFRTTKAKFPEVKA